MKAILINTLAFLYAITSLKAQEPINKADLKTIYITDGISVHFVSPEPIQYVDISSDDIMGDIPVDNVLRIKYVSQKDTTHSSDIITDKLKDRDAVITVVGQSFIAQYKTQIIENNIGQPLPTNIEIIPTDTRPLDFPEITLTNHELEEYALKVMHKKRTYKNVSSKSNGMTAQLNNIFSLGDYIFLDVEFNNQTHIKYDIDDYRFKIEDKRIVKSTNVQEVKLDPLFTLYKRPYFTKKHRNVFVFKKFTYPNDKVLTVQLTEKQISGRMIELKIDYRDLLNADTL